MKKRIAITVLTVLAAVLLCSCTQKPKKNERVYGENSSYDIKMQKWKEEQAKIAKEEEEARLAEEAEATVAEEAATQEEEDVIDTHVYTGDELSDELIKEKIVGYWEFDDFGYLGGYRFFDTGFLQLVLDRKVNQTGIFMVRYEGVYFSLDSKNWDDDVLMIQSVSDTEIVGTFGNNVLTLHRADENLVEENSGIGIMDSTNDSSTIVDAATEIDQNMK